MDRVIFRVWKDTDNEVLALFPDMSEHGQLITCYAHIGQHGQADYYHCMKQSRPAQPHEYARLKAELEGLGYELDVRQKRRRL